MLSCQYNEFFFLETKNCSEYVKFPVLVVYFKQFLKQSPAICFTGCVNRCYISVHLNTQLLSAYNNSIVSCELHIGLYSGYVSSSQSFILER